MRAPRWPPVPPIEMPPARTVRVPDRGEFFMRDTGGDGTVVMLLHGWIATADLNWWAAYGDLAAPAIACWRSTTAATGAGCARSSRSGSSTAPPTPPPC